MKLNGKIYQQLTGEPFVSQEIDGKKIDFHYMNDTPYLFQYASKGRFAVWTSDGQNYRVLIEKTYYEALEDFYQEDVNKIWLNFLDKVGKTSKKFNLLFNIPALVLYLIVSILAVYVFQDYTMQILLGMIVLVVIVNMVQGRIVNSKVREENKNAQDEIRNLIGNERFDELVKAQEDHYQNYFKFNEENTTEEVSTSSTEQIGLDKEENNEELNPKDEENHGTKIN